MRAAFPPILRCSLPVRPVKSASSGIPITHRLRRLDCPAAAGRSADIRWKAASGPLGEETNKTRHPTVGSFPSCDARTTGPRREHGGSSASCRQFRPSTPGERDEARGFGAPSGGPHDESLIIVAGIGDSPHFIIRGEPRWFPLAALTQRGYHEGMCGVLTANRLRPADKNVSINP